MPPNKVATTAKLCAWGRTHCLKRGSLVNSAPFSRPRLGKKRGHKVLHGLNYGGKLVEQGGSGNLQEGRVLGSEFAKSEGKRK